jgi:dCTP diphosphatase
MSATIAELTVAIGAFADARDWRRFHNPKNLVLALVGEVGEVAELLQWLTPDESAQLTATPEGRAAAEDELADVAIYLLRLADELDVDLAAAVQAKLARNEQRFPADGADGR